MESLAKARVLGALAAHESGFEFMLGVLRVSLRSQQHPSRPLAGELRNLLRAHRRSNLAATTRHNLPPDQQHAMDAAFREKLALLYALAEKQLAEFES